MRSLLQPRLRSSPPQQGRLVLACSPLVLSRTNRLRTNSSGNVERSLLLDLVRLQCDDGNVEAWILRDLNQFEHSAVESLPDSPKRSCQGSLGRLFSRSPKSPSGAGALHPREVPARLTDHRVK